MEELERIKERLKLTTRKKWEEIAPKLLSQARLETTNTAISCALQETKPFQGRLFFIAL
jgi:hypothetical protein